MLLYQVVHPSEGWPFTLTAFTTSSSGANLPAEFRDSNPLYERSSLNWIELPKFPFTFDPSEPYSPDFKNADCVRAIEKNGYFMFSKKNHVYPEEVKEVLSKAMGVYKTKFEETASELGGHVSPNAQHSALWKPNGFSDKLYEGVCFGLAVEWLKERAANKNAELLAQLSEFRDNAPGRHEPGMKAFVQAVTDAQGSQTSKGGMTLPLAGLLTLVCICKSEYPFSDLSKHFPPNHFFYLSTGHHAMAASCSSLGAIDFYDPNVGLVSGIQREFFGNYLGKIMYATYEITKDAKNSPYSQVVTVEVYKKA